jgi:hypothetical protein
VSFDCKKSKLRAWVPAPLIVIFSLGRRPVSSSTGTLPHAVPGHDRDNGDIDIHTPTRMCIYDFKDRLFIDIVANTMPLGDNLLRVHRGPRTKSLTDEAGEPITNSVVAVVHQAPDTGGHGMVVGLIQGLAARSACFDSAVLAMRKSSWMAEGPSPTHT